MSKFQEYLEAANIVSKSRGSRTIVLNKRDSKFENKITNNSDISGFKHGDSKNGYSYKFANDGEWETALKLLGVLK